MKNKLIKYVLPAVIGAIAGIVLREPIESLVQKAKDKLSGE